MGPAPSGFEMIIVVLMSELYTVTGHITLYLIDRRKSNSYYSFLRNKKNNAIINTSEGNIST